MELSFDRWDAFRTFCFLLCNLFLLTLDDCIKLPDICRTGGPSACPQLWSFGRCGGRSGFILVFSWVVGCFLSSVFVYRVFAYVWGIPLELEVEAPGLGESLSTRNQEMLPMGFFPWIQMHALMCQIVAKSWTHFWSKFAISNWILWINGGGPTISLNVTSRWVSG